jgi:glycine cleavage system H protein
MSLPALQSRPPSEARKPISRSERYMNDFLETTYEKFTFRVAVDCYFSPEGIWCRKEEGLVRMGLSDFLQQRSGDVAFAETVQLGTTLRVGDEVATIETIKVNISLTSPISGTVLETNPSLKDAPEIINQDPYGDGWIALMQPNDWEADRAHLLNAQSYLALIQATIEEGR